MAVFFAVDTLGASTPSFLEQPVSTAVEVAAVASAAFLRKDLRFIAFSSWHIVIGADHQRSAGAALLFERVSLAESERRSIVARPRGAHQFIVGSRSGLAPPRCDARTAASR